MRAHSFPLPLSAGWRTALLPSCAVKCLMHSPNLRAMSCPLRVDSSIDLRERCRELATSLRELRRARRVVVSDPDIMGGDPVFRGTRVPVHMIAELVAKGSTPAELIEDYPRLTAEMIRLAPVYAAAYPLRGRPRNQPRRDQKPVHRTRRRLDSIAVP